MKNSSEIIDLLNGGAKINMMNWKVMKNIGLVIKHICNLEYMSYIDPSFLLFSFYKDIEFAIIRIKTRHLIFVLKHWDHNLILGQLFFNLIKFF